MIKILNSLIDFASEQFMLNRNLSYLDDQWKMQQQYVKNSMNKATSLFNRNYYRHNLETLTSQNMLKRVREQIEEQNKALRNTAVITGVTPQAAAAAQVANNKLLDSTIGNLAAADVENKQRQLEIYDNTRNKLQDYLYGGMVNYYNQKHKLENERFAGFNTFFKSIIN